MVATAHQIASAGLVIAAMVSSPLSAHGDKPDTETTETVALNSYTDEQIRGFTLKGFRLGMPLQEAQERFGFKVDAAAPTPEQLTVVSAACGDNRIGVGRRLMAIGPEQERYSLLFDADGLLQSVNVAIAFPPDMNMAGVISSVGGLYGAPTARSLDGDGSVRSLLWAAEKPAGYENDPSATPSADAYLLLFATPTHIRFDPAKQVFEQADGNVFSMTLSANPKEVGASANCP